MAVGEACAVTTNPASKSEIHHGASTDMCGAMVSQTGGTMKNNMTATVDNFTVECTWSVGKIKSRCRGFWQSMLMTYVTD